VKREQILDRPVSKILFELEHSNRKRSTKSHSTKLIRPDLINYSFDNVTTAIQRNRTFISVNENDITQNKNDINGLTYQLGFATFVLTGMMYLLKSEQRKSRTEMERLISQHAGLVNELKSHRSKLSATEENIKLLQEIAQKEPEKVIDAAKRVVGPAKFNLLSKARDLYTWVFRPKAPTTSPATSKRKPKGGGSRSVKRTRYGRGHQSRKSGRSRTRAR
jgi:hypothetical protein